jgi:hypothetical protein
MMNLNVLGQAIVTSYQDIPEIVAALNNDPATINFFSIGIPESPEYADTLAKLSNPGMLISHLSTVMGLRGGIYQWRHTFRIDFKIPAEVGTLNYFDFMELLVNGIPSTSDGLTVEQCSFDNDVDSMEDVIFQPAIDSLGKGFYRMEFALQERGGSGS